MMASNQTDADMIAASVTALIPARDGTGRYDGRPVSGIRPGRAVQSTADLPSA
jgi:hypothetical protein